MKAKILSDLHFANIPGEPKWFVLLEDLWYYLDEDPKNAYWRVPENFVTDLFSIPRIFQGFFSKHSEYSAAAVVHDYRYAYNIGTRGEADKIFLLLLKDLGMPWWQRNLYYAGVRVGGFIAWSTDRPKPIV